MLKAIQCHKCGHSWSFEPPMGRRDACPGCRTDARICQNCRFYDPSSYRECREEQAEWVKEKDRGNFCSYFDASSSQGERNTQQSDVKSKLNALFGSSQESEAKSPGADMSDEIARFLKSRK